MTKLFNKTSQKQKRKNLRNNLTPAELILWGQLKNKQLKGFKFRRQFSIGKYIVDFYCPKIKLVIEIDGDSHYGKRAKEYDLKRQKFLESFGVKFLRFANTDIYKNLNEVIEKIKENLP